MHVCFLAGASSIHTVRWVNSIVNLGHEVSLITMHPAESDKLDVRVNLYELKIKRNFGYYLNVLEVRRLLGKIKPDLLNTHYASGYGTLSRLTKFSPTLLSVWGSDVYLYPYMSNRNEKTLRRNLSIANCIASTSNAMKNQIEKFVTPSNSIEVTPFGIDLDKFVPMLNENNDFIVIGTVKQLKSVYGIDILITATAQLLERLRKINRPDLFEKIRLKVIGSGPELETLKLLTLNLNIKKITEFVGKVPNKEVPNYLNEIDIFCAFSHSESFGVSVLEASACEIPVVVSDVGGLPEVVQNGETGYVVNHKYMDEIVEKLLTLVINKDLRLRFGQKGRKFVEESYDWNENVLRMEKLYQEMIDKNKG